MTTWELVRDDGLVLAAGRKRDLAGIDPASTGFVGPDDTVEIVKTVGPVEHNGCPGFDEDIMVTDGLCSVCGRGI